MINAPRKTLHVWPCNMIALSFISRPMTLVTQFYNDTLLDNFFVNFSSWKQNNEHYYSCQRQIVYYHLPAASEICNFVPKEDILAKKQLQRHTSDTSLQSDHKFTI